VSNEQPAAAEPAPVSDAVASNSPGGDGSGETDTQLAHRIAATAGQLVSELRRDFGPIEPGDKARLKELRDTADRASHDYLVAELAQARPEDAILSEEGVDETQRDSAQRLWIIDPLDGTKEYGTGLSDFAIHVALWDRAAPAGSQLTVGLVDLPAQGLTRATDDTNIELPHFDGSRPMRLVVSRSRPPQVADAGLDQLSQQLADAGVTTHGVEVINVGSVGAKVNEVLCGRADAYVHDTGFYEWDVAAPLAVAHHYGLVASHLNGAPVTFNHRPPWVENLVVCLPVFAPFLIG
jgi:3'(2'), 5'-bisphosphate nucleotidase